MCKSEKTEKKHPFYYLQIFSIFVTKTLTSDWFVIKERFIFLFSVPKTCKTANFNKFWGDSRYPLWTTFVHTLRWFLLVLIVQLIILFHWSVACYILLFFIVCKSKEIAKKHIFYYLRESCNFFIKTCYQLQTYNLYQSCFFCSYSVFALI